MTLEWVWPWLGESEVCQSVPCLVLVTVAWRWAESAGAWISWGGMMTRPITTPLVNTVDEQRWVGSRVWVGRGCSPLSMPPNHWYGMHCPYGVPLLSLFHPLHFQPITLPLNTSLTLPPRFFPRKLYTSSSNPITCLYHSLLPEFLLFPLFFTGSLQSLLFSCYLPQLLPILLPNRHPSHVTSFYGRWFSQLELHICLRCTSIYGVQSCC